MTFASRTEAGVKLGQFLAKHGCDAELVLGLPRGGVVVAAEVARILGLPLDIIVVRKIGHPWNREFAVGAIGEDGVIVLDEDSIGDEKALRDELDLIIAEETNRLREYRRKFSRARPIARTGRPVLVVDDGLATGATAEAAVKVLLAQQAKSVTVAAPVASATAVARLRAAGAVVIALHVDRDFAAVGQYYLDFAQTTDEEVLTLLRQSKGQSR